MQNTKWLFYFLILIITGCNIDKPCKDTNIVCTDSYESLFRIVSKIDGKDLVFGPNKFYDKSKIKIYSLKGSDTTFANYEPYRLVMNGYDSVLHFNLSAKVDTLFIRLNSSDIDTLSILYGLSDGRCCSFNSIRFLNYNNAGVLPNFNGTVEFKK